MQQSLEIQQQQQHLDINNPKQFFLPLEQQLITVISRYEHSCVHLTVRYLLPVRTEVWKTFQIVTGDITKECTDAIVVPCDLIDPQSLVYEAVHDTAGPELTEICKRAFAANSTKCSHVNTLVHNRDYITSSGFNLPCKNVIHVLSPSAGDHDSFHRLGESYLTCLRVAKSNGWRTLSFPAIGTGNGGFPVNMAAQTAVIMILTFLLKVHLSSSH